MAFLHVELVAADRKVWEGEASSVSARGIEGDLGVLPGHAPLLTVLADGEVRIHGADGPHQVHIDSGFLSVDDNIVRIVAETVTASTKA
ncbi:ATP synthase epsilon chain [Austwickia sp. TVS 96-490-7B]|uniref:F0F1 ATP synthase subunit epsilon n=1 Tax=Austwickia sp. TVS 96-490-7B TaxID=2830843 RepID=UPI001C56C58A|nr:F0F1 ATP synthase subunit epsilon [Austwickia sp. TVS 96-490-7B]MBW3084572.1 ATP synthase epsilon chain [Austwickia sp. TVS 96-490-7B]